MLSVERSVAGKVKKGFEFWEDKVWFECNLLTYLIEFVVLS